MIRINENYLKLPGNYLFSEVAKRIAAFRQENPEVDVIRMDIGDVSLPLPGTVVRAMQNAVAEMGASGFKGYGPERGYSFLRDAISKTDYQQRGIDIQPSDIFISDGAKSDLGNLTDIFASDIRIAVPDPGYPVYVDDAVLNCKGGDLLPDGRWSHIVYLECNSENGFIPEPPHEKADLIILCSPSNPAGTPMTKESLEKWVEYARENRSVIIYDSAYEAYVRTPGVVKSIYEIEHADEVAIEVRSFSKTAGFTGVRCGYTVVPSRLCAYDSDGGKVPLQALWNRRQSTKFNGVGYIVQRGAEALFTEVGMRDVRRLTDYYLRNASLLAGGLRNAGYEVWGGVDSPYVWVRVPGVVDSWHLFDDFLHRLHISCTPGKGFGPAGEGFIRLTGFNSLENTQKAVERICSR